MTNTKSYKRNELKRVYIDKRCFRESLIGEPFVIGERVVGQLVGELTV